MVKKTVYDIMLCNNIIYKLIEQQIEYKIQTAYKLYQIKKDLDEIELLMVQRWEQMFGSDYNVQDFTEDQLKVYNITLMAEVEIDTRGLILNDLISNDKVSLTLSEIEHLDKFLKSV